MSFERTHVVCDFTDRKMAISDFQSTMDSLAFCEEKAGVSFASFSVIVGDAVRTAGLVRLGVGWSLIHAESAIYEMNRIFRYELERGDALLLVEGGIEVTAGSLQELSRTLESDPSFCLASSRIGRLQDLFVQKIDDRYGDPEIDLIPKPVVTSGPDWYRDGASVGPCCLLSGSAWSDLGDLDESFSKVTDALRHRLRDARRLGFFSVTGNRSIVRGGDSWMPPDRLEIELQHRQTIEDVGFDSELLWAKNSVHAREGFLARISSGSPELRKTLLVDVSGLSREGSEGVERILGLLGGMVRFAPGWTFELLSSRDDERNYALAEKFPGLNVIYRVETRRYSAAIRLTRLDSFEEILALHSAALLHFFFISEAFAEAAWLSEGGSERRVVDYAANLCDALIFESESLRIRFHARFRSQNAGGGYVSRISLDPQDYVSPTVSLEAVDICFVANSPVSEEIQRLKTDIAMSFPSASIKLLARRPPGQFVDESSSAFEGDMVAAFEPIPTAKVVVLPDSRGLPSLSLVRCLAQGRTVVARRSELLMELGGDYRGPGKLIVFGSLSELIQAVGATLHQNAIEGIPPRGNLEQGASPVSWKSVGTSVLEFIDGRIVSADASTWEIRQSWSVRDESPAEV